MPSAKAGEHEDVGTWDTEKLLDIVSEIARYGNLFDVEAVRGRLAVRLGRTTGHLYRSGQFIGTVDTYHPIGTPTNYWLPPTGYEVQNQWEAPATGGRKTLQVQHASLDLSWGIMGRCISGSAAQRAFGAASVLPAGLPLDGHDPTTTWRWRFPAHDAEPVQLDALFFPSGSKCMIALHLSQARKIAIP